MGRGNIVNAGTIRNPPGTSHELLLPTTRDMSPRARLIISYTRYSRLVISYTRYNRLVISYTGYSRLVISYTRYSRLIISYTRYCITGLSSHTPGIAG